MSLRRSDRSTTPSTGGNTEDAVIAENISGRARVLARCEDVPDLVCCPINNMAFAVGQLAVFQGASEVPISGSYGSSEQRGKTATGHGPEGCDENGPVAALLVGYVSI